MAITTINLLGVTQTTTINLHTLDTLVVVGPGTLVDNGNVGNGAGIVDLNGVVEVTGNVGAATFTFEPLTTGAFEFHGGHVHGTESFNSVNAGDSIALHEAFNSGSLNTLTHVMTLTQAGTSVDAVSVTLAVGASNTFDFGSLAGTTLDFFENVVCFAAGTHLATPGGEVPVERLAIGDPVLTASGKAKPIRWIGHGCHLITKPRLDGAAPVIVRAGALGEGMPRRDLRLTKGHSLFVDGVLIPVEFLINHRTILWDDRPQVIEFYHVELEGHDVLIAEGAPSESYRDDGNRGMFDSVNPAWDVRPEIPPCAPVLTVGPEVDRAWRRLSELAGQPAALTGDPDLHLVADGARVDAASVADQVYRFELAAAPATLRVASRSAVPAAVGLNRDERRLGVALRRIVLSAGGAPMELGYESACLTEGFHAPEPEPGFRWTAGDAAIWPGGLAMFNGPLTVELHVGCTALYPMDEEKPRARLIA